MTREEILTAIDIERARQRQTWNRAHDWGWGDCSSPLVPEPVKVMVLAEESGEVVAEMSPGDPRPAEITQRLGEIARATMDRQEDRLKVELVQLAACCVAWLESL